MLVRVISTTCPDVSQISSETLKKCASFPRAVSEHLDRRMKMDTGLNGPLLMIILLFLLYAIQLYWTYCILAVLKDVLTKDQLKVCTFLTFLYCRFLPSVPMSACNGYVLALTLS